jgi:hypothetical protein
MALQTTRIYGTPEICAAITVSGTVNPAELIPVGNRQLKKPIPLPEQIRLSLASRTNHQAKTFRVLCSVGTHSLDRSLKQAVPLLFHPKKQIRIGSLKHIFPGRELAEDGILMRQAGG